MQKIRIELTETGGQIFKTNNRLISISPIEFGTEKSFCTLYDFKSDGTDVPDDTTRVLYRIGGKLDTIHLALDLPFKNGLYAVWEVTPDPNNNVVNPYVAPVKYTANVMLG